MPELAALVPALGIGPWLLVILGALVVGFSKTALPGAGTIAVGLFALAMPAKESTAALLLLLIVGDLTALWVYRREPDIKMLVRLIPSVMIGVVAGTVFFATVGGDVVRGTIGIILLALVAVTVWRRRAAERTKRLSAAHEGPAATAAVDTATAAVATGAGTDAPAEPRDAGSGTDTARPGRGVTVGPADPSPTRIWISRATYGLLGGFTTMVANAGGPVMTMYFYAMRLPVLTFLGTAAWFFAIVNILKLPFSASLGLFSRDTFVMDAMLIPVVLLGAFVGARVARRFSQGVFEKAVLVLTVVSALGLLVI
ncbi:MAG TPA: sulfite exporter TauE/SafE family protein [Actinomycetaceae bacterium]|nr:sulfite exporter TauE/SafE family protein [Actinomycetaceae bacterium]